ncbi:MAG: response regulator [Thermodesulfobacteriota bacterium]
MPKRILIIDDEPDICAYLCAALEDEGYQARAMGQDEDLAGALNSDMPDLIVLDVMMPVRSGVSLYKELKSVPRFSGIPVIIISGMSPKAELIGTGFTALTGDPSIPPPEAVMEKPLVLDALFKLIRDLTD